MIPIRISSLVAMISLCSSVYCGTQPPTVVDYRPRQDATGVMPEDVYYIEVSDPEGDIDADSVHYAINSITCKPLVKPTATGYRFMVYPPHHFLPLQTISVDFSVSDMEPNRQAVRLNYSFVMSRWNSGNLMPGFDGHPIYGLTSQFSIDGVLHIAINDDHRLLYLTYDHGKLSDPTLIDTEVCKTPILRRDLDGAIHLAWYSTDKGGVLRYTNNQLGFFNEPVEYPVWFFPYSDSMPFDMVVDFYPVAHLLWTEEAWTDSALYYAPTILWLPPEIEIVNQGMQPYLEPHLAIDFANRPSVIWRVKANDFNRILWTSKGADDVFDDPASVTTAPDIMTRNLRLHVGADNVSRIAWEEWPRFETVHYLAYTSDLGHQGSFKTPSYLGALSENFRIASKLLYFPNRLYYLCFGESGLYFTNNETGTFGILEPVAPWSVAGASLILGDYDNLAVILHGGEIGGLRIIQDRQAHHRPFILAAGWMDSQVSTTGGGQLRLTAVVADPGADLDRLELFMNGVPTGTCAPMIERPEPLIQIHELQATAPPGQDAGDYLVELVAFDRWGQAGAIWPAFEIVPSEDYFGNGHATGYDADAITDFLANTLKTQTSISDSHSPRITLAGYLDSRVSTAQGGQLTVAAVVTDIDDDVESVTLVLEEQIAAFLTDDGRQGDERAGDRVYTAVIDLDSALAFGAYRFKIVAVDRTGNFGSWPTLQITP